MALDAQRGGCRMAQVNDAVLQMRAAVDDAHRHLASGLQAAHNDTGAERQRLVRGSQLVHVVALAAGGLAPMQHVGQVGGRALLKHQRLGLGTDQPVSPHMQRVLHHSLGLAQQRGWRQRMG